MEIKLNGVVDCFALINKEDYGNISQHEWFRDDKGYAQTTINNKPVYMHTFIMNPPKGMVVDHINHKRIDNRKENLRIINRVNNGQNKSKNKNATSQYYGVH